MLSAAFKKTLRGVNEIFMLCDQQNWSKALEAIPDASKRQINFKGPGKHTPLHCAVQLQAPLKVVQLLLERGAEVNAEDDLGWTALHHATAFEAPLEMVQLLVVFGAEINHRSKNGQCPLQYAVYKNAPIEVVKFLIDSGADINSRNEFGFTALYMATTYDAALLLIESGAQADSRDEDTGWTPLHRAIVNKVPLEVVELLVSRGADVNMADERGETPLMLAAKENVSLELTALLLRLGASVMVQDNAGRTAFDWAIRKRHPEQAELLNAASFHSKSDRNLLELPQACPPFPGGFDHVPEAISVFESIAGDEYDVYFSYSMKDAMPEVTTFYRQAMRLYHVDRIFPQDLSKPMKIFDIISAVERARNVVVLLSGSYIRPTTLVELHVALASGATVVAIRVVRSGVEPFDSDKVRADIAEGRLVSYMSDDAWALLREFDIDVEDVGSSLLSVINAVTVDFTLESSLVQQDAIMQAVFDCFVV